MIRVLIVFFFLGSLYLSGQSHEMGLRSTGFNSFELLYKRAKSENRFHRFRSGFAALSAYQDGNNGEQNLILGLSYGYEKRAELAPKTVLLHGLEPSLSLDFNSQGSGLGLSLGYILGLQYHLNEQFNLALEVIPSLGFRYRNLNGRDIYQYNLGFNSQTVALTVVYKFKTI